MMSNVKLSAFTDGELDLLLATLALAKPPDLVTPRLNERTLVSRLCEEMGISSSDIGIELDWRRATVISVAIWPEHILGPEPEKQWRIPLDDGRLLGPIPSTTNPWPHLIKRFGKAGVIKAAHEVYSSNKNRWNQYSKSMKYAVLSSRLHKGEGRGQPPTASEDFLPQLPPAGRDWDSLSSWYGLLVVSGALSKAIESTIGGEEQFLNLAVQVQIQLVEDRIKLDRQEK